ncbi:MAG: hypothetical protein Q4F00_08890 [bacterium]|nr:hypothetical protein [bacterium]
MPRVVKPIEPIDPSVHRVVEPVKPEAKQSILQTIRGKVSRAVDRVLGWLGVSSKRSAFEKLANESGQDTYYGNLQPKKTQSTAAKEEKKELALVTAQNQTAQSVKQETNTTSKSTKTHNNTSKNNHQLNSYNELIETVTARHIDDPARTAIGDYAPISTIPAFVAEYLKEKGDNTDHDGLLYISDKRIVHSLHEKRSNYDAVTLKAFKGLPELLAKLGISDDELLGYYYQYAKGRHALIIVVQNTEPIKEEALISNEKRYCAFIFHIQKGKYFLTTVRKYSVNDLNNLTKIK